MKVLVVDDNRLMRKMLSESLLEMGHEVVEASNGLEGLQLHALHHFPLIITDWEMPELNGLEMISKVRELETTTYTYIILVTARDGHKEMIRGIAVGADEYITKPFSKDELSVRVRASERIIQLQKRLERMLGVDASTGMNNIRGMLQNLSQRAPANILESPAIAILQIGLDPFMGVTETFDSLRLQAVIGATSTYLKKCVRKTDEISRAGPEDFVVAAPGLDLGEGASLADRIRCAFARKPLKLPDGDSIDITVSVGVAMAESGAENHLDAAMNMAGEAVEVGQREGGNRVKVVKR